MKREYRFSSILWIMIIVGLTNYLLIKLMSAIGGDNFIVDILGDLLTGIISFVFVYSISSGLIRNRMGSVGDYLNQVNYINMKVLTVGFLITIANSICQYIFTASGAASVFQAVANPSNKAVFAIGTLILPIVLLIIFIVIAMFFAYSNFYLADHYDTEDGVMEIIGKIFGQGKRLFKKTLILGLKFTGLPILLFIIFIFLLVTLKDELVAIGLLAFFILAFAITILITTIVLMARLSDVYLDDKIAIEQ
ncbi:hypothetical protein [uncultured Anaerococcus sp.]|uniref:hypothetical protein n=1 Tax=uncultured Anaerococcus sp. TaxID=293428 RepID=UPI00288994F6|nr:hypothetical protein [uncultured Anaerococcus sp.]